VDQPESVNSVKVEPLPSILLADDDPVTRLLLARTLKKSGFPVDVVADGTAALDRMIETYYPILISDWEMPGMDGLELCRTVRHLQLDGYVYVLLLTSRDAKEHMVAGLEAGADDYLIKPIYEPELLARLNTGRRILALEHSLRRVNEENLRLSITDALTGAFNRRQLMEQLPRELERCRRYGQPLSVVMCDIDHFKRLNDRHGHAAGDAALRQFVACLQKCLRTGSDWIARYGGEEFVIVLPETQHPGAMQVAGKIRDMVAGTVFGHDGTALSMTASFGVASSGPNGPDLSLGAEAMLAAADLCLYRSKQSGRNAVTGLQIGPPVAPADTLLNFDAVI
jgi:diguanylate cyclase (GGDEF)-like protein